MVIDCGPHSSALGVQLKSSGPVEFHKFRLHQRSECLGSPYDLYEPMTVGEKPVGILGCDPPTLGVFVAQPDGIGILDRQSVLDPDHLVLRDPFTPIEMPGPDDEGDLHLSSKLLVNLPVERF